MSAMFEACSHCAFAHSEGLGMLVGALIHAASSAIITTFNHKNSIRALGDDEFRREPSSHWFGCLSARDFTPLKVGFKVRVELG